MKRLKNLVRWIDRNLWSIPVIMFVILELAFSVWSAISRAPVLLAALSTTTRQTFYTSLTGTSGTFFTVAIAVVAVLVAFTPRVTGADSTDRAERDQARARRIFVGSWLAASLFMVIVVITATIAQVVDLRHIGNSAITTLIEAAAIASVVGLLIGGAGLTLVLVERSQ